MAWAPAEADADEWLAANHQDFDQFPVRQEGHAVGILIRDGTHSGKVVRDAMQPLRDGLIVSADMPIVELILTFVRDTVGSYCGAGASMVS